MNQADKYGLSPTQRIRTLPSGNAKVAGNRRHCIPMSWPLFLVYIIPIGLLYLALRAIKQGRIAHWWRGKEQAFHRESDPWMFWFLTATHIGLSIMALVSSE